MTRLVDNRETFIVFALNPDGMRFDLTGSPYRAWRKNRQVTSSGAPQFTDLNRNYSYKFALLRRVDRAHALSITYRGPAAFCAPETRALRNFVESRVVGGIQQIRTHITLHTNGELILWPYGYTRTNLPPDMTAADRSAFVGLGQGDGAPATGIAPSSRRTCTSPTATRSTGSTSATGSSRSPSSSTRRRPRRCGATTTRPTSGSPSRRRATGPRSCYLIDRAACPYAASTQTAAALNDCGPLYDDFEIPRAWKRDPGGNDTATDRALDPCAAAADDRPGPQAARARSSPGSARW